MRNPRVYLAHDQDHDRSSTAALSMYNPSENVTVDERLYFFKGRCQFRQYMPKKPAKYGIKFWVACCSKSSYAWKMQIYTGKASSETRKKNQGMRVVLDMVKGLKDLPFSEDCTIVSYLPKKNKNVLALSTMHNDNRVSDGKGRKPDIILHYNNTKGGVDNLDKMTSTYSCQRMTARWPLVIFYNIIDVSAYNAYVLWTEKHPTWNAGRLHKRRLFVEELGKALVQPEMMRRKTLPRTAAAKSAVERLRKDAEQPSTSGITMQVVKKELDVNCAFKVTTRQAYVSQYDRKTNCATPMGRFDPEDKRR
ncbi:PiggyBac transposable element-derived protein 4 [Trichinella sp. T9]|nr:PiggyBac transposable element-derived protein 4 [Trichinella sp. T9]